MQDYPSDGQHASRQAAGRGGSKGQRVFVTASPEVQLEWVLPTWPLVFVSHGLIWGQLLLILGDLETWTFCEIIEISCIDHLSSEITPLSLSLELGNWKSA